jgi:hypothetical protein
MAASRPGERLASSANVWFLERKKGVPWLGTAFLLCDLVAGKRNRLVLPGGNASGRPDVRTANLVQQDKMVAGACKRLNLLFSAPGIRLS